MATGLILSAAVNALMGLLGLAHSVVPTAVIFVTFAVMWGINGWAQSMGAPPAIISLSRWYPLRERGTYYGFFSASHNLGEFFSFLFVGSIVTFAGWQAGFFGSAVAGAIGVVIVLCWLHDTPESKGLPPVEALAHEKPALGANKSVREIQKQVLRTPAVWVLAAASAFMYISRYAINGWGVLFLQEAKGILGCGSHIRSLNKCPAGNTRNRALGMVLGQTLQRRPKDTCPVVRHTELPSPGPVPIRRKCHVGEHPLDGSVWNSDRSADLFPRRTHGRGHRAEKGDGGRAGSGGYSVLLCCGNSGCRVRMAHRCEHYRNGRWNEAL